MIYLKDLALNLWAKGMNTVVYFLNKTPTKKIKNVTPFEKWFGKQPNLEHVKVFSYFRKMKQLWEKITEEMEKVFEITKCKTNMFLVCIAEKL